MRGRVWERPAGVEVVRGGEVPVRSGVLVSWGGVVGLGRYVGLLPLKSERTPELGCSITRIRRGFGMSITGLF